MNKEQFEQGYAFRSGVTVEWLHEHGQEAVWVEGCDAYDYPHWEMQTIKSRRELLEMDSSAGTL